jgi:hypothetical protein
MKWVKQYVNIKVFNDHVHRAAVSKVQDRVPGGSRLVTVTD